MADIVLAENNGQTWLVSGERFIDDLLANTLPADVTIEFIVCESELDFTRVKSRMFAEQAEVADPWIIHPAIARRVRQSLFGLAPSGHRVSFSPWSAARDRDADAVIAAAWEAAAGSEANIILTSYSIVGEPPPMTDLASLRSSLIEAELMRLGVEPSRFVRARKAHAEDTPADYIDITIGLSP